MQTLTGKRSTDLIIFGLILFVMVICAPLLRVYHKASPTQVEVVAIDANQARTPVPVPAEFAGTQPGLFSTVRRIREFTGTEAGLALIPPGGSLEWSLVYERRRIGGKRVLTVHTTDESE